MNKCELNGILKAAVRVCVVLNVDRSTFTFMVS
jgi:hypothetical protein